MKFEDQRIKRLKNFDNINATEISKVKVLILAAGKGSRMQSTEDVRAKVLRNLAGKSLLSYVLNNLRPLFPSQNSGIVLGYQAEAVSLEIKKIDQAYSLFYQEKQLGTGHAVMTASSWLTDACTHCIVCYGDMPMISTKSYAMLLQEHLRSGNHCTFLSFETKLHLAYGRIIRNEQGNFVEVVEDKDCSVQQKQIKELNMGVYAFETNFLLRALHKLTPDNTQAEYYLTDVPKILLQEGLKVGVCKIINDYEGLGVNTVEDLQFLEEILQQK